MPRTKAIHHAYAREAFDKSMDSLTGQKLDNYGLFFRGFLTGMNFQRSQRKAKKQKQSFIARGE